MPTIDNSTAPVREPEADEPQPISIRKLDRLETTTFTGPAAA
jgi:hypothetical protein